MKICHSNSGFQKNHKTRILKSKSTSRKLQILLNKVILISSKISKSLNKNLQIEKEAVIIIEVLKTIEVEEAIKTTILKHKIHTNKEVIMEDVQTMTEVVKRIIEVVQEEEVHVVVENIVKVPISTNRLLMIKAIVILNKTKLTNKEVVTRNSIISPNHDIMIITITVLKSTDKKIITIIIKIHIKVKSNIIQSLSTKSQQEEEANKINLLDLKLLKPIKALNRITSQSKTTNKNIRQSRVTNKITSLNKIINKDLKQPKTRKYIKSKSKVIIKSKRATRTKSKVLLKVLIKKRKMRNLNTAKSLT